jgi:predicted nucleotidyltransferase
MRITNIKNKIKEYFFINPTVKMRVRQIEKILKLPLPSIIRYCKDLEKEGILKTIKIGNVNFYTADRSNEKCLLEKKLFNIRQLYDSGLINHLKLELHNPAIIVFGSYSKGEDIEDSDIDIFIETTRKEFDLNKFEKILSRKIQIFAHKSINEVKNTHLANNILNGVVLNGYLEVFK